MEVSNLAQSQVQSTCTLWKGFFMYFRSATPHYSPEPRGLAEVVSVSAGPGCGVPSSAPLAVRAVLFSLFCIHSPTSEQK